MTAGNGDRRSSRKDSWTGDELALDCVTQSKGHSASTTQIADGGDAGAKRDSGGSHSAQQQLLVVLGENVEQWGRGVAEDEVHVTVDESGQDGQPGQIHNLGIGRRITRRGDALNLPVFDVQRPVTLNSSAGPVNQQTSQNDLHHRIPW